MVIQRTNQSTGTGRTTPTSANQPRNAAAPKVNNQNQGMGKAPGAQQRSTPNKLRDILKQYYLDDQEAQSLQIYDPTIGSFLTAQDEGELNQLKTEIAARRALNLKLASGGDAESLKSINDNLKEYLKSQGVSNTADSEAVLTAGEQEVLDAAKLDLNNLTLQQLYGLREIPGVYTLIATRIQQIEDAKVNLSVEEALKLKGSDIDKMVDDAKKGEKSKPAAPKKEIKTAKQEETQQTQKKKSISEKSQSQRQVERQDLQDINKKKKYF